MTGVQTCALPISLVGGYLIVHKGMPTIVGILAAIILGMLIGVLNGVLVAIMDLPAYQGLYLA